MPAQTLPKLPLVCLQTADDKDTIQVVEGKNTIIGKYNELLKNSNFPKTRADNMRLTYPFPSIQTFGPQNVRTVPMH